MCMQMHDMAFGLLCLSSFVSLNVLWFYLYSTIAVIFYYLQNSGHTFQIFNNTWF